MNFAIPLLIIGALLLLLRRRQPGQASITQEWNSDSDEGPWNVFPSPDAGAFSGSGSDALDNITQAIARLEGYGVGNNRPTRNNNPGDLKWGLNMTGKDKPGMNGIAQFSDPGDGWDALSLWVTSHTSKHPEWDFYDLSHYYATGDTLGTPVYDDGVPADPDHTAEYIAGYLGVEPTTTVSSLLY